MFEMEFDSAVLKKPPVSRLQLLQAQFQRKLLLEKEEKMMQLYPPESSVTQQPQRNRNGGGGAVRQFFAQRRAQPGVAVAVTKDPLNSSNGLISLQQSMNGGGFQAGTFSRSNGNKHGSPVGWDKSYPLSPLDRDSSSSSSGYDSLNSTFSTTSPYNNNNSNNNKSKNSQGKVGAATTTRRGPAVAIPRRNLAPPAAAARRAPSLDRRPRKDPNGNGAMRRSNSQVFVNGRDFDEDDGFVPFSRVRKNQPNKFDVPKISPAARKSRPSNQPANLTYKVPSPGREQILDDSNPKGRRPVVPAIGQRGRTQTQAKPANNKKSSPRALVGRPSTVDPNLVQCHMCGRNFAPDRIAKHETICEKSTSKKRKVFDPTKMRIKGTDMEDFQRQSGKFGSGGKAKPTDAPEPKKTDWRQKRNNFIETLRQAKVVQRHVAAGGRASDLPPPPPMDTSDYVQCPHCGRKFSEGAAERHVPKCKNIKSNKNSDVRR